MEVCRKVLVHLDALHVTFVDLVIDPESVITGGKGIAKVVGATEC